MITVPGPARLAGFETQTIENIAAMTTPRLAAGAQPGCALALVVLVWAVAGDASDRGQSAGVDRALGHWVAGL